jgi:hypothetical protein
MIGDGDDRQRVLNVVLTGQRDPRPPDLMIAAPDGELRAT